MVKNRSGKSSSVEEGQVLELCFEVRDLIFVRFELNPTPDPHQEANIFVPNPLLLPVIVFYLFPLQGPTCDTFIRHGIF